jgi:hypothetical protein
MEGRITLSADEFGQLVSGLALITGVIEAHTGGALDDSGDDDRPGMAGIRAMPEPKWIADYRRSWKFLKAVDEAGGDLTPEEMSKVARDNGYHPSTLGGFYNGDGALRAEGDRRVLTEAGRRYLKRYGPEFGEQG